MSNIYIQEPPTFGKVLLTTTVGEIEIELWSKETPKACRNFVQLCLEGYYNGLVFHRVVKGFIAQTGDPTGTGTGGESIYGAPFKDEIHSRLRFNRRGLVAMANGGRDDNASQFFFTFNAAPELQKKHTIFGKVVGETIYNLLKIEDVIVDQDDRPVYPIRISKTEVLHNPFTDIVPRVLKPRVEDSLVQKEKVREKSKAIKDYKLLSFGDEAEEDEEELNEVTKKFQHKAKSTHDILEDPTLSKQACQVEETEHKEENVDTSSVLEKVRKKLNTKVSSELSVAGSSKAEEEKAVEKEKNAEVTVKKKTKPKNPLLEEYNGYVAKRKAMPKKGALRESQTMALLEKFKSKLAKRVVDENPDTSSRKRVDIKSDDWMNSPFICPEVTTENKATEKNAVDKGEDWFDITDPRNPMAKRRREDSKKILQQRGGRQRQE